MTMIPSIELVSVLLGVTGDEPEVIAQRANEFEVTVEFLHEVLLRHLELVLPCTKLLLN